MTTNDVLNVSLSAVQSYRQCQQQYSYRYVEKLRRKDAAKPLLLGSILHHYLEKFYYFTSQTQAGSTDGLGAQDAHVAAQLDTSKEFSKTVRQSALVLKQLGLLEQAHEMAELMNVARRISDRYFLTRGQFDADEYEFLMVEEWINIDLLKRTSTGLPRVRSNGKIDALTRHRDNGRIHLWEHKSGESELSLEVRLRHLQPTLYNETMYAIGKIPARVDAVMWNYIRTKEPTVPELVYKGTKRESLTRRADLDSTWEVYAKEITRYGLNPDDYEEQRERLSGREVSVFFKRHPQVILVRANRLLGDYEQTAREIRISRRDWAERKRVPVRTLSTTCDWCEYKDLCNAALLAGSDRDARSRFNKET